MFAEYRVNGPGPYVSRVAVSTDQQKRPIKSDVMFLSCANDSREPLKYAGNKYSRRNRMNAAEPFHQEELKIVSDLVDVLMADSPLPSDALESQFLADWNESTNDDERLRVAIDQVASLTDNSALALHSILC